MAARRKPKRPPDEDEAQSQRFIEMARELEAEGELEPDKDEGKALDRLVREGTRTKKDGP